MNKIHLFSDGFIVACIVLMSRFSIRLLIILLFVIIFQSMKLETHLHLVCISLRQLCMRQYAFQLHLVCIFRTQSYQNYIIIMLEYVLVYCIRMRIRDVYEYVNAKPRISVRTCQFLSTHHVPFIV